MSDVPLPPVVDDEQSGRSYLLPAQFRNGLRGYTKGVEIAPEWRPASFWRLRGSYSFLQMNVGKSPGSGDVGTPPFIVGASPRHEATAMSSFDLGRSVQADLTYRYVGHLLGIPAYSTGDARFTWRFTRELELTEGIFFSRTMWSSPTIRAHRRASSEAGTSS